MKIAICIRYCIYFAYEKCAQRLRIRHVAPLRNVISWHSMREGGSQEGCGMVMPEAKTNAQVAGRKLIQLTQGSQRRRQQQQLKLPQGNLPRRVQLQQ